MLKFDIIELFSRLCGLEYKLLKHIRRIQGDTAAPVNFYDAATALNVEKDDIRRAFKRLVDAKVVIADCETFQINEEVFKKENNE